MIKGSFDIQLMLIGVVAMILSITVHEYAHARVSFALGDDTAEKAGRLTLNPLPHIDIIGTILIPIIAAIAGNIPLIGWAKPVPVSPYMFNRKISIYKAMALVSVAGPLSNLILGIIASLGLKLLTLGFIKGTLLQFLSYFFYTLFFMNLGLCVFNLIPVPPLDGSKLLPPSLQEALEHIRPFSYLILIGIVYFGSGILSIPIRVLATIIMKLVGLPSLGIL